MMRWASLAALLLLSPSGCGRGGAEAPAPGRPEVPGLETAAVTEISIEPELDAWATVAPSLAPALRDARAERQAAEARAALAGRQLERLVALGADSAVPAKEIEAARAELAMANAALARARSQEAEFGDRRGAAALAPGSASLSIQVTQRDIARVRAGARVHFRPDDGSDAELEGSVIVAPSYVDPGTGLAPVIARVDGGRALTPGTTGSARIATGPARRVLSVPREALVFDGKHFRVFVARGAGVPLPRTVEVGDTSGDRVEVRGELAAGDQVVTTGAASLLSAETLLSEGDE